MRYLPFILVLALTVYAAIDCLRTPDDEVKHLPKIVWLVVVLLVWLVGPILWLLAGRNRGVQRAQPRRRPVAPDDDPEFLRRLEEQRRLRSREEELKRREQQLGDEENPGPHGATGTG